MKVCHLLPGIQCRKISTTVAAVKAHPDKNERDFQAAVVYLFKDAEKRGPMT